MPKIELKDENERTITFKQRIRNKFKAQVDRIISHYELNTLVLVLDELTAKILSRLFDMLELVDFKITYLQRLEKKRKPLDFHALYFVAASQQNIKLIIADFQDQEKPQYKKVHILFTSFVDRKYLKQIAQCKPLFKKISKHSIKQFNFELRFLAENALSMDISYFSNAYGSDSPDQIYQQGLIAKKFIEIIAGYDQVNVVRIYYQKSPNMIAERLAKRILKEVKTYYDELMDAKSHSIRNTATDLTFFVVDRSIDVITPVLHSFTYESLLFDVLKIAFEGTQEANNPQYRKFEEIQDEIYEKIRFNHISVSMEWLHQQLTQKNEQLKSLGEEGLDLKKLTNEIKLLEKHITMSLAMIEKFNQKKLNEIGQLQQCIATGIYDTGKPTSSVQVLKSAIDVIKNNIAISPEEKLRIAIICLCGIKTSKTDYLELLNLFSEQDQKVLKNLVVLGVNYDSSISKSTKAFDNLYRNQAKQRLERTNMPLDRYSNTLQTVLPKLVNDIKQDNKSWKDSIAYIGREFISVLTEPNPKQNFDQSKFVCFVCGGLSFAELCSLKKQKSMENIILIADNMMSPSQFIKDLRKINKLQSKSEK